MTKDTPPGVDPNLRALFFTLDGFINQPAPAWYVDWRKRDVESDEWSDCWAAVEGFTPGDGGDPFFEIAQAKGTKWSVFQLWAFSGTVSTPVIVDPEAVWLFFKEVVYPTVRANRDALEVSFMKEVD